MTGSASKKGQYFSGIQGLRGAASLAVLLYHLGILLAKGKYFGFSIFGGFLGYGYRGVDLFFVISGFVMGLYVENRNKKSPLQFAEARVRRIFVPYLPEFLGMSLLIYLAPSFFPEAYSSDDYSFVQNLFLIPRQNLDTFVPVVAWSLAHELYFYLMVGVLVYVPFGRYIFYPWLAASAMAFVSGVTMEFPISFLLSRYNLAFALGIAAYFAAVRWHTKRPLIPVAISLAGLALAMTLEARSGMGIPTLVSDATYFASFAMIVFSFARVGYKPLEFMGNFSYSLYLVHYPILVACMVIYLKLIGNSFPQLAFLIALSVALCAGYVYYRLIEQRSMSLRIGWLHVASRGA